MITRELEYSRGEDISAPVMYDMPEIGFVTPREFKNITAATDTLEEIHDQIFLGKAPSRLEQFVSDPKVEAAAATFGIVGIAGLGGMILDHIGTHFNHPDFTSLNPLNPDTALAANLDQQSSIGGKGFSIDSEPNGVMARWQSGTEPRSYLLKLTQSGVTRLPRGGSLPPLSAQYMVNNTEISTDPIACYMYEADDQNDVALGNSDLLCAIRNIASATGAPGGFTLSLNEGRISSFSVNAPSTPVDARVLLPLGREAKILPANTTSFTDDTLGNPSCYILIDVRGGAAVGITDILCGFPGFARIPTLLIPTPTLTIVRATEVRATETPAIILPSPTRTPTPTEVRTATPTSTKEPTRTSTPERQCSVWPAEATYTLARIPVVDGLCYIRTTDSSRTGGAGSVYDPNIRSVIYLIGGPGYEERYAAVYEIGHAHQHLQIVNSGLFKIGSDFWQVWLQTDEGKAYSAATQVILDNNRLLGKPLPWEGFGQNLIEEYSHIFTMWYTGYYPRDWFNNFPSLLQFAQANLPESLLPTPTTTLTVKS